MGAFPFTRFQRRRRENQKKKGLREVQDDEVPQGVSGLPPDKRKVDCEGSGSRLSLRASHGLRNNRRG